jgi:hypothetical protein
MLSILQLLSTGPCCADAQQVRARPFGTIRCMFWMLIIVPSGGRTFLAEANVVSSPLVQFDDIDCTGITRDGSQSCGGGALVTARVKVLAVLLGTAPV